MFKLYELTEMYQNISNLIEEDADNETLEKALDEITDNIQIKAENMAKLIKSIEGNINALKDEEKRLQAKRKALENKVVNIKEYLENQLKAMGLKKVQGNLFTVSIQKNPQSVNILNEDLIPEQFKKVVTTTKIDRKELLAALKEGQEIEGAEIKQTESLRIR